jgi:hypothetical protein
MYYLGHLDIQFNTTAHVYFSTTEKYVYITKFHVARQNEHYDADFFVVCDLHIK